jgi:hypothetical protein
VAEAERRGRRSLDMKIGCKGKREFTRAGGRRGVHGAPTAWLCTCAHGQTVPHRSNTCQQIPEILVSLQVWMCASTDARAHTFVLWFWGWGGAHVCAYSFVCPLHARRGACMHACVRAWLVCAWRLRACVCVSGARRIPRHAAALGIAAPGAPA